MKLLVTGGSGFFGSRIGKAYQGICPGHGEMDILDRKSIEMAFERIKPEMVVHCAAVSDVGWCGQNPEKSWQINVEGTENIARVCGKWGARLIYCSSDQVYLGSSEKNAHKESEKLVPANEYGRQKLEAEKRCFAYCEDSVALRLSWMYDMEKQQEKEHGNFMLTLMEAVASGREMAYPVYDYRGITDVRLAVENMEKVFGLPSGIYNYGSENSYNTYETVYRLLGNVGLPVERLEKNMEAFADSPRNIRMDMGKLKAQGIEFPDTLTRLASVFVKPDTMP